MTDTKTNQDREIRMLKAKVVVLESSLTLVATAITKLVDQTDKILTTLEQHQNHFEGVNEGFARAKENFEVLETIIVELCRESRVPLEMPKPRKVEEPS